MGGWADDAFADGVVPGWEGWLQMRRDRGVLLSEWEGIDVDNLDKMEVDSGTSLPIR